jgi:peptide/nickel transport system permease protein
LSAYIIKRFLWAIPTLLGAITLVFLLMNVLPGDIAQVILAMEGGRIDPTELAVLREKLGLNVPMWQQYLNWLGGLFQGNLGVSLWTGRPVAGEILQRLPYTGSLVIMSMLITIAVAVPVGIISATRQDSWLDYLLRTLVIGGIAIPNFWFALLLMLFLVVVFRWHAPLGYATLWSAPLDAIQQLIWPALTLGFRSAASSSRMMRSSMLEVMREDYIRTARAMGIKERIVIYGHGLRNAILPVVTMFGMEVAYLFSGSVIIETVFNIPGVGLLMIDAINHRDVILVQGIVVVLIAIVLVVNLLTDLVYAWVDPRIRYR